MTKDELNEIQQQYLTCMWEKTGGEPNTTVSMFDIGEMMGLERDAASRVAEDLIGFQYLEVKSLSGGVALTEDGNQAVRRLGANGPATAKAAATALGKGPLLTETEMGFVEQVSAKLKTRAGEQSWNFDALMELMADLKTIDAQLASPKPKTAIIRECLRSVLGVLKVAGAGEMNEDVRALIGD